MVFNGFHGLLWFIWLVGLLKEPECGGQDGSDHLQKVCEAGDHAEVLQGSQMSDVLKIFLRHFKAFRGYFDPRPDIL